MRSQVSAQSDHSIITVKVNRTQEARGPGLWRFNTSLLANDEFIDQISEFLANWTPPKELNDPCVIWDWLKFEIKNFVIKFSKNNHSQEKQTIKDLQDQLQDLTKRLDQGEEVEDQIASVRLELKQVEDIRANRLIFNSRCRWASLGEKPSSYFLNMEKRRNKDKTLSAVILPDKDTILTDSKDILQACAEFYTNLYAEGDADLAPIHEVQEALNQLDHPRLSDQTRASLDAQPTIEELRKALLQL